MNFNLIKAIIILSLTIFLFYLYFNFYYNQSFNGNYYSTTTKEPVFSFGKNGQGHYWNNGRIYPFSWKKGKTKNVGENILVFTPSLYDDDPYFNLPTVYMGKSKKKVPVDWPVIVFTAKQISSMDSRYLKFKDIGLFSIDMGKGDNGEDIFSYFSAKKSLVRDLINWSCYL